MQSVASFSAAKKEVLANHKSVRMATTGAVVILVQFWLRLPVLMRPHWSRHLVFDRSGIWPASVKVEKWKRGVHLSCCSDNIAFSQSPDLQVLISWQYGILRVSTLSKC